MKVLIQRYGIVIKSIEVSGERARVGNSPDSEVMIDDPYLSANVAELAKKNGEWRIVDSGTSLEGVLHNGARIEDEPIEAGSTYHVGGFELVIEGIEPPPWKTAERPMPSPAPATARPVMRTVMEDTPLVPRTMMETDSRPVVPRTMMETDATPIIPKTMFETPMPAQNAPPARVAAGVPAQAVRVQGTPPAATPPRRNLKPLIFALAGGVVLLLLLAVLTGGKKKAPPPVVAKKAPVAPVVAPVVQRPASGDEQIQRLQIDTALDSWEAELKRADDPKLRDRFCAVAAEVASVHLAAGDPAKARQYYQRIVSVGAAESEMVKLARTRL